MTRQELNKLVEKVIFNRDDHRNTLRLDELDALAEICNIVDHNLDKLCEDN